MATPLIRVDLRSLYEEAREAHPGLLLQRGMLEHDESKKESKTKHIREICDSQVGDFYRAAFQRWKTATSDPRRFRQVTLKPRTRVFIGLAGGGMLETGCAISHSHGAPYLPGSSIKGVVNAFARDRLEARDGGKRACDELFGAASDDDLPGGLAGLIVFHDAWWVPDSAGPLVQEIVTSHHLEYYGNDDATPASDFDSPVPNAQIAVQGAFLFVLEGPAEWLDFAVRMLTDALSSRGIGAKTRSGYGLFAAERVEEEQPQCAWLNETIQRIADEDNANEEDVLKGRRLATAWDELADPLKREAFIDIRNRWHERGWWDDPPPGKAIRRAKAVYDAYQGTADDQ